MRKLISLAFSILAAPETIVYACLFIPESYAQNTLEGTPFSTPILLDGQ